MEIPVVTIDELRQKIEHGERFVLVDALAPMVYAHSHLPGAVNVHATDIDPLVLARRIPDRETEIIVYCTNPECDDSIQTASRLRSLGYTKVRRYAGGKNEWRDTELPLERAGQPFVPRDAA